MLQKRAPPPTGPHSWAAPAGSKRKTDESQEGGRLLLMPQPRKSDEACRWKQKRKAVAQPTLRPLSCPHASNPLTCGSPKPFTQELGCCWVPRKPFSALSYTDHPITGSPQHMVLHTVSCRCDPWWGTQELASQDGQSLMHSLWPPVPRQGPQPLYISELTIYLGRMR